MCLAVCSALHVLWFQQRPPTSPMGHEGQPWAAPGEKTSGLQPLAGGGAETGTAFPCSRATVMAREGPWLQWHLRAISPAVSSVMGIRSKSNARPTLVTARPFLLSLLPAGGPRNETPAGCQTLGKKMYIFQFTVKTTQRGGNISPTLQTRRAKRSGGWGLVTGQSKTASLPQEPAAGGWGHAARLLPPPPSQSFLGSGGTQGPARFRHRHMAQARRHHQADPWSQRLPWVPSQRACRAGLLLPVEGREQGSPAPAARPAWWPAPPPSPSCPTPRSSPGCCGCSRRPCSPPGLWGRAAQAPRPARLASWQTAFQTRPVEEQGPPEVLDTTRAAPGSGPSASLRCPWSYSRGRAEGKVLWGHWGQPVPPPSPGTECRGGGRGANSHRGSPLGSGPQAPLRSTTSVQIWVSFPPASARPPPTAKQLQCLPLSSDPFRSPPAMGSGSQFSFLHFFTL